MSINVVCTSKPSDGLLHYSYEYASLLDANLIIIPHPGFSEQDYLDNINKKYIHCNNVMFNDCGDGVTLVMGRSMITLPYLMRDEYSHDQLFLMMDLFKQCIVVYSENHPADYPKALEFFGVQYTVDLCDHEVYPNGIGRHFEKTINFSIYKKPIEDVQYKYLYMGTNEKYYASALRNMFDRKNSAILVYPNAQYLDNSYNHVYAPVDNLLGMFDSYVYTKDYFDPAPRLIQEFKWMGKEVMYERDVYIEDGGHIYYRRKIIEPDVQPILEAYNDIIHGVG